MITVLKYINKRELLKNDFNRIFVYMKEANSHCVEWFKAFKATINMIMDLCVMSYTCENETFHV